MSASAVREADRNTVRRRRARIVYGAAGLLFGAAGLLLLWFLNSLILPSLVGALLAYVCFPVLDFFKRKGLPKAAAILLLFGLFFMGLAFLALQIQSIIPDDNGKLEFRVRVQYKMNEKYRQFMGLDSAGALGNTLYAIAGNDINPLVEKINRQLRLTEPERHRYKPSTEKFSAYYRSLLEAERKGAGVALRSGEAEGAAPVEGEAGHSSLSGLLNALSLWSVSLVVFLFLLVDDGAMKKSLVSVIPNRYFEMTLTILDNVDHAIGNYLRGTFLECTLVGGTLFACLFLTGVQFKWSIIIGLVAGAMNAVPFLGPFIGLIAGMCYAFVSDEARPLLPYFTADNLALGVLISVGLTQFLDNWIYQPVILGGAVNLHPLIVSFGVLGGALLFGVVGMLFAVPAIVVFKVVTTTLFQQLKAYCVI